MLMRGLIAAIVLALVTITAEAQHINLQSEKDRLQKQAVLLVQFLKQTNATIPRQVGDFHCTTNLLHTTSISVAFVNWMKELIDLSAKMRDPTDKAVIYTTIGKHNELAMTMIDNSKTYIDVAAGPCPENVYVNGKATELRSITTETLAILTQIRAKVKM